MAQPRHSNPVAFAGLLIAAGVLATTIYLHSQHRPSSLILADTRDVATVEVGSDAASAPTSRR
jgi:hypothetical protein